MTVIRLIARPMLASMFVVGGIDELRTASQKAPKAAKVTDKIPPLVEKVAPSLPVPHDAATFVRINGAVMVGAALALATGRAPRASATVLAATMVPVTYAGHAFWQEQDADERKRQRTQFFKNVSMIGGLLLAGVDTEGRPGVAWRVKHAARDVRREGRRLAKDARHEAKLAKAQLT